EQRRGDATVVPTQIIVNEDTYAVDYEMLHQADGWRAADVVVEGVSMTSNYSDQFASLLRDRSFDELLDLMRRKVEHMTDAQRLPLPRRRRNRRPQSTLSTPRTRWCAWRTGWRGRSPDGWR